MAVDSDPVLARKTLTLNEEQLLREIGFYDRKASDYSRENTPISQALATVYRYSAQEKRQRLAALLEHGLELAPEFPY